MAQDNPILAPHVPGTRIHMTFAPGKKGRGALSGTVHNRNLQTDLLRLRDTYETTHLITLVEDFELDMLHIADLREAALQLGMQHLHFPIVDLSVPEDLDAFEAFVDDLKALYQDGATFTIHCVGGLGRTGVLAAILLQELHGYRPEASVDAVRKARNGTIQTREQEDFVLGWRQ
ncbi:cyclin-dependent kinase inhibitor 3 family protein [Deinococcus roseus]|uniref:Protein-tyrosine-phosphatase n=1 Tax=Deinococcus roseus TaxID=392414 RepID=A0ABQ2DDR8_9DEIO|nr:cyclin-dependent kinase inhibitor 3 family protein [Deinococcus roseus]GGJ54228.1 protein-tyrosine-phosphatase [Deinococcus roseus]